MGPTDPCNLKDFSSCTFLSPLLPVPSLPCQPLSHVGTFTIRLLQTTIFQNTSFADTEGLGLLEDIELGSFDKHTWSVHLYQPWVHSALPRADWDIIENLIKMHFHEFNHVINAVAMQTDVPYPFVAQCMAGCVLYPNRTSQGFAYVGYNGQDFLSLNTKTVTWAFSQDTKFSRYVQSFLENHTTLRELEEMIFNETCVDEMKVLVHCGRAALERQGEP
uniref:MHC class I-like antigen recognition-like domain-containing protein n=1 Tax=Cyanoderma ruficeps TaxID=181631 RepID=A0A8C3QIW4_9PASS